MTWGGGGRGGASNLIKDVIRKEGNVLFNDSLKTIYLRLYGVGHMVEDHSDSKRGNPLPPHGLLFLINSKVFLICSPIVRIAHTTAFVIPVVDHWLEHWLERGCDKCLLIYL